MHAANVAFLVLLVLAAGFFAHNAQRLVRFLNVGFDEDRTDHPLTRVKNVLTIGIAQTKILRDPVAGAMHASVFWGFMVLTLGTIEILVQGVVGRERFSYASVLPRPVYYAYLLSQEAFALLVLGAVAYLLYRRLVIKPKRLQGDNLEHWDALLVLGIIASLMLTLVLNGAFESRFEAEAVAPVRLVSRAAGALFGWLTPEAAQSAHTVSWWTHAALILGFLNYLPYSKHLHVITSLPNTFFSNTSGPGQKGVMRYMDLEADDVEQFGASDVEHLSWKNLLDGYSCTQCGRCTAACPANLTGKVLSPRKIVVNARQRLMEKAPLLVGDRAELAHRALVHGEGDDAGAATATAVLEHRLLDNYITEEELWACTSCRACVTE